MRVAGFTLIELMIVVAVVALLAAIALPSYQDSVRKARRADARVALTTAAQMMERYYTENNKYDGAGLAATSENRFYNLAFAFAPTVNTFEIRAEPAGAQAADPCGTFTLTSTGKRGVTGGTLTTTDCW